MAVIIEFKNEDDILRGMEFLDEAEETYYGVPKNKFVISNTAARMLEEKNVKFEVIGDENKEKRNGTCP